MKLPEYVYPGDENAMTDVESGYYGKYYEFKPGDVVVDIGAHVGFFTEWVLPKIGFTGNVIAIEPHPRNYDELVTRTAEYPNVHRIKAAASSKDDAGILYVNSHNSGAHSLSDGIDTNHYLYNLPVRCINIGRYLSLSPYSTNLSFVKIDTEGAEGIILISLRDYGVNPKAFAIEIHRDSLMTHCKSILTQMGYSPHNDGSILYA